MAISDLPGYVQGYKFDDTDSLAWDGTNEFFIDQAGYSANPASRLELSLGSTYAFTDVGNGRGLILDNQAHWTCMPTMLWHGSVIAVMGAPSTFGSNATLFPIIGGGATSVSSNARIYCQRVTSADYRHGVSAASAASTAYGTKVDDGVYAHCFSGDQENRLVKALESDGSLTSGSVVADNNSGVEVFKDVGTNSYDYARGLRVGNISGVRGSTTVNANTMVICELHFFNSILTDSPTTSVEAELVALEAVYNP